MFYSSESSDSENQDYYILDVSHLSLDSVNAEIYLNRFLKYSYEDDFKDKNSATLKSLDLSLFKNGNKNVVSSKSKDSIKFPATFNFTNDKNEQFNESMTEKLLLNHNNLTNVPSQVIFFTNIKYLDLSNNNLTCMDDLITTMTNLQTLYLKNNSIADDCLPKDFLNLTKLKELNLSGNRLTKIPQQIFSLLELKYLYLGNNEIDELSPTIKDLIGLQVLHLGGNKLTNVPAELGNLVELRILALCDNNLRRLPRSISNLYRLRSLLLHKNNMCCLPSEIVKLQSLTELSLRENPLVTKFVNCCVKELINTSPSLQELSARSIKLNRISYAKNDIPKILQDYINSGEKCVNPKCEGVYFTSCVEHVKLVDFCGKYRVPLMHYLCSSKCTSNTPDYYRNGSDSDSEEEAENTMRKVLLG